MTSFLLYIYNLSSYYSSQKIKNKNKKILTVVMPLGFTDFINRYADKNFALIEAPKRLEIYIYSIATASKAMTSLLYETSYNEYYRHQLNINCTLYMNCYIYIYIYIFHSHGQQSHGITSV